MVNDFSMWLTQELNERGWHNSELARRSGMGNSTVSQILSGVKKPGWDFCANVAKAFGYPAEKVFRIAKLLPPSPEATEIEGELLHLFRQLPLDQQRFIVDQLRGVVPR